MKSWKETKENLEGSGTIFKLYLNSETFKKFFTWVHTKTWNTPKWVETTQNYPKWAGATWDHPLLLWNHLKPPTML